MTTKQQTPYFKTAASTGQTLSSDSFRGKVPVAMVFLPNADPNSDTISAFNDAHSELARRRVQLLAVVPETASEARVLAERGQLTFPVLADPSLEIFREFDAIADDDRPIERSVIVDKTGTVAATTEGVLSPSEMTAQLDDLEGSSRFEMAVNR